MESNEIKITPNGVQTIKIPVIEDSIKFEAMEDRRRSMERRRCGYTWCLAQAQAHDPSTSMQAGPGSGTWGVAQAQVLAWEPITRSTVDRAMHRSLHGPQRHFPLILCGLQYYFIDQHTI